MTIGAEQGEIAEVGTPIAVAADPVDGRQPWRWTTSVIGTAALLLALTNAQAVQGWFDELSPSAWSEPLRRPIERWSVHARTLGLDAPRAAWRRAWQAMEGARFENEHPGEQGVDDAG